MRCLFELLIALSFNDVLFVDENKKGLLIRKYNAFRIIL